ncbi:hypothetical protein [Paraburkholderia sp. GAS334]|uniref:hypothetical protein n=1 Tax=Paraburkholderia sp. GAS334 TaxID=3035131 RepID=UPI003D25DF83
MKIIERNYASERMLCLSAHKLATHLVLFQASVDATGVTPDVLALREAGLAQLVDSGQGTTRFSITDEGNAALRILGAG